MKRMCNTCGEDIKRTSYKDNRSLCHGCKPSHYVNVDTTTYGELSKHKGKTYANIRIREWARKKYLESDRLQECYHCGYNEHFEICHIEDVTISEINDIDNLVALCPNHHWELDYGSLTMFDM